jgi:methionyl-tRNA formyltransferase
MNKLRIAFMGTPDFAVHSLRAILEAGHEVAAVYTQPPAPRGRGQVLQNSPVHAYAQSRGLEIRTPKSMKAAEAIAAYQALNVDVAVVVAYGQILVPAVLDAPRLGSFNLHGSLLPRWRGAAPIQRAVMAGDARTGVQVMRMSVGLDEGAVLFTAQTGIGPEDTSGVLHDRLAVLGAELWPHALQAIAEGTAVEVPQSDTGATYARKITPAEARIDWTRPAAEVDCHIRGLSPFPGAWFQLNTAKGPVRVKVLGSRKVSGSGTPGQVLDDHLTVACADGAVRLTRLQREGRGAADAVEFLRGTPVPAGEVLG